MYWCLISSCWINNKLHGAQRVYRILQVRGTDISDVQQKKVKWNSLASAAVLEPSRKIMKWWQIKISLREKYSTLPYFTLLLPLLSSLCFSMISLDVCYPCNTIATISKLFQGNKRQFFEILTGVSIVKCYCIHFIDLLFLS